VGGQDILQLGAVDVLSARDDHVLLPVDDVNVTVRITKVDGERVDFDVKTRPS